MNKREAERLFRDARLTQHMRTIRRSSTKKRDEKRSHTTIDCPRCGYEQTVRTNTRKTRFECDSASCRPDKRTSGYRFKLITGTAVDNTRDLTSYVRAAQLITSEPFVYPTDAKLKRVLDLETEDAIGKRRDAVYNAMKPAKLIKPSEYVVTVADRSAFAFELKAFHNLTQNLISFYYIESLRIAQSINVLLNDYFAFPASKFTFIAYDNTTAAQAALRHELSATTIPPTCVNSTTPSPRTIDMWQEVIGTEIDELRTYPWYSLKSQHADLIHVEMMFYRHLDFMRTTNDKKISPFKTILKALALPQNSYTQSEVYDLTGNHSRPRHWESVREY